MLPINLSTYDQCSNPKKKACLTLLFLHNIVLIPCSHCMITAHKHFWLVNYKCLGRIRKGTRILAMNSASILWCIWLEHNMHGVSPKYAFEMWFRFLVSVWCLPMDVFSGKIQLRDVNEAGRVRVVASPYPTWINICPVPVFISVRYPLCRYPPIFFISAGIHGYLNVFAKLFKKQIFKHKFK